MAIRLGLQCSNGLIKARISIIIYIGADVDKGADVNIARFSVSEY